MNTTFFTSLLAVILIGLDSSAARPAFGRVGDLASHDVESLPRFLENGGLQGPMHEDSVFDSGYLSRYNLQSPTGGMKTVQKTSPNLLGEPNEAGGSALLENARLVLYRILYGTGEKTETDGAITADQIMRNMMSFEAIPTAGKPHSGNLVIRPSESKMTTTATDGDSPKSTLSTHQIIRNMMPFEAIPLEEEPHSGLSEGKVITSATN
ncbi:uncharacterized protein PGTG_10746 [Puccinia graminis f. sp. tritici CRL 75-36-700-3]|uniref:Uncharacterized protein n=1 Tax=Puccinia graminis f. sp. tritici (strain CRL 75-36-700-3 / race SCCL) TaxID=418459 RepID=E3KJW2_PUCGT|nr:uncharacterized protein PGTG_10746 [Puccinia graminis f. sp. tritici CRL 75-36-700-3]EFP84587.1 hypothetical protein PGTG_10746 [Puccinia graminis f. sp. tritici CRL 75-36-700-3]